MPGPGSTPYTVALALQIAERVEKGAAHLDRVRPGWENEITLREFKVSDPCRCVIGMLAKKDGQHYTSMSQSLGVVEVKPGYLQRWGELGFDITTNLLDEEQDEYAALQVEWVKQIEKRRGDGD